MNIIIEQPHVTLINNIIVKNAATTAGVFQIISGDFTMVNNTVAYNTAVDVAVSLSATRGALAFRMLNNIFWNPGIPNEFNTSVNVSAGYNDVRGGLTGTGNINADPYFLPGDTLYSLSDSSVCLGAGVISATVGVADLTAPSTDYFGAARPRPGGSQPDLGATENDLAVPVGVEDVRDGMLPKAYSLEQNYPNPFNPSTTIRFALATRSRVKLSVYNLLGQVVATLVDEEIPAGVHEVPWNAVGSSGVYFYRLEAEGVDGTRYVETRKLLFLK